MTTTVLEINDRVQLAGGAEEFGVIERVEGRHVLVRFERSGRKWLASNKVYAAPSQETIAALAVELKPWRE